MRTPVAKLLKKVEKGNTGGLADIPKHSKKVIQMDYINFILYLLMMTNLSN